MKTPVKTATGQGRIHLGGRTYAVRDAARPGWAIVRDGVNVAHVRCLADAAQWRGVGPA